MNEHVHKALHRGSVAILALAVAAFGATAARAQTFSPGELARPHAALEGMAHCTKCHVAAGKLGPERCLACHTDVAARLKANTGLHGKLGAAERQACEHCHTDHQGRDAALIDWGGAQKRFDHGKTGYALTGKHAGKECDVCHTTKYIADATVREGLAKEPQRKTLLGLPTACKSCHFDEHRGQIKGACDTCHTTAGWKPAPGFSHTKTTFALLGKHAPAPCAKCHVTLTDEAFEAGAFPPPRAATYVKFTGVAHAACLDCHKDFHEGKLGAVCERCHSADGWRKLKAGGIDQAFHARTRFPLLGLHVSVPCARCHGPFPGVPVKYKGLPFEACTSCHFDAHFGQLTRNNETPACTNCHDNQGFVPPRYEPAQHAQTRFALAGAHVAVACVRCHAKFPELGADYADAMAAAQKKGLAVKVSYTKLRQDGDLARCETCHRDPHGGQLVNKPAGCAGCHEVRDFRRLTFMHDRDSSFALSGKHAQAPCVGCHARDPVTGIVRYKPVPTACAACHRDPHFGQLARDADATRSPAPTPLVPDPTPAARAGRAAKTTDCARCHETLDWKRVRFDHNDAKQAGFALGGQHSKAPCAKCHPEVTLASGAKLRRYKPVPTTCERCHADVHRGAFADVAAALATHGTPRPPGCVGCHSPDGWRPAMFPHEATGFALEGPHGRAQCSDCHGNNLRRALSRECSTCHRDPHAGEFGARCAGCHEARSWRSTFNADAHRRTSFPLIGRHAVLPCTECHGELRDRSFARAHVDCVSCHADDYDRAASTSIDHRAAGFGLECQACHSGWTFATGSFPAHEVCFALSSGPHARIGCRDCHTTLDSGVQITGACNTGTAACTACHSHSCARSDSEHRNVPGYQCRDRKCYECHRFAP